MEVDMLKNQKGQSLIEYMVIVALMAVGTMGAMRVLSQNANGKLTQIIHSLQGGQNSATVRFDKVEASDLRKKDMSDFFQGSRSQRSR